MAVSQSDTTAVKTNEELQRVRSLIDSRQQQYLGRLREVRIKAKADLLYLARNCLEYDDLVTEQSRFHPQMAQFVQADNLERRIWLISRGFLKTSLITIADTIHRFVKCLPDLPNPREKPDFDQTVLLVGPNLARASQWIWDIRSAIEDSPTMRAIFPDLEPNYDRWTATKIDFVSERRPKRRAPHIECVGVGGNATGSHQSIIKFDDIVDRKNTATGDLREKTLDYYRSMQPVHGKKKDSGAITEMIVGTPYHFDDLYATLIAEKHHHLIRQSCWGEDGHSIWPEMYPDEWLMKQRDIMGPTMFAAQYECDPSKVTADTLFHLEWFRYYTEIPEGTKLDVVARVDPGTGVKGGDAAGIVIAGKAENGDIYFLHTEGRNYDAEGLANRMDYLNRMFRPRLWEVESNGTQASLRPIIERKRRESSIYMRVKFDSSESLIAKEYRIGDMAQRFELQKPLETGIEGTIRVPKLYMRGSDMEFRRQMRYYKSIKPDDVVDAASCVFRLFTQDFKPAPHIDHARYGPTMEEYMSGTDTSTGGWA